MKRSTKQRLIEALRDSQALLVELAHDMGGCDHTVNICQCGLNRTVEENAKLLRMIDFRAKEREKLKA
jgi:hypothetical protein